MLTMKFLGMSIDPESRMPIAVLRQSPGDTVLPVALTAVDAVTLSGALAKDQVPGPLMFEVFEQGLRAAGSRVASADLVSMEKGCIRARISIETPQGLCAVDARPADAIAMAMLTGTPIHAGRELVASAARAAETVLLSRPASAGGTPEALPAEILHQMGQSAADEAAFISVPCASDEAERDCGEEGCGHECGDGEACGRNRNDRDDSQPRRMRIVTGSPDAAEDMLQGTPRATTISSSGVCLDDDGATRILNALEPPSSRRM